MTSATGPAAPTSSQRTASFDVFDTLLTRTVGSPWHAHVEAGRLLRTRGVVSLAPQAFAASRVAAAVDLTGDIARHAGLSALAADVARRLGLPAEAAEAVAQAELDVEWRSCRAVPGAVDRVAGARSASGRGVVFVSDTPLPRAFLRSVLEREGLFREGDQLFVSADDGASKQHGGLFGLVADRLQLPGGSFDHTGDDRWADVAHARERGWRATHDAGAPLAGRELRLAATDLETEGLGPRLAAAARTARLQAAQAGADAHLAGIAGGVALPMLVGFARWVLGQAALLGVDRLYFLARDGELLMDAVRRLSAATGQPVDCRYLHGSRSSWQRAAAGRPGRDVVGDLQVPDDRRAEDLTPTELLGLLDLRSGEPALPAHPLVQTPRCDEPLGEEGWQQLQELLAEPAVAEEVHRRAASRYAALLQYLDEQQVTAPGAVALVDVGWSGRVTRAVEDVLAAASRPLPAAHLFVGVLGSAADNLDVEAQGRLQGWLFDELRGRRARTYPAVLVESFLMGREAVTTGYEVVDGRAKPVLAAPENPEATAWDMQEYRRALGWAWDAFLDDAPPALTGEADLVEPVWRQLLDFWEQPTPGEAAAWGRQPHGVDVANHRYDPLAQPVTVRRLLAFVGWGPTAWRRQNYWPAGSVALSAPWLRPVLRAADRALQERDRVARIPRRLRLEWLLRRPPR